MPKTIYGRIGASSDKCIIVLHCNVILGGLEPTGIFLVTPDCVATKSELFNMHFWI